MLIYLLACTPEADDKGETAGVDTAISDSADTGSVKPPEIILGDPYIVMVAATTPGSLNSTCELDLEITNKTDGGVAASLALQAEGRDWDGAPLVGGTLYSAVFTAVNCSNLPDPEPYVSGSFSGQKGTLFVLWYTGVNIGYDALEQTAEGGDFLGGEATVVVANSTPDSNVVAVATSLGVSAALQSTAAEGNTYLISWESEVNVGAVLAAYTEQLGDDYVSGTPTWLTEPSWW